MPRARGHRASLAFLVTAGVLSLLVAVGSGFAIATIWKVDAKITKIPVGSGCKGQECLALGHPTLGPLTLLGRFALDAQRLGARNFRR